MSVFVLVLGSLLVSSCDHRANQNVSETKSNGGAVGQHRGIAEIELVLSERVLAPHQELDLGTYLGENKQFAVIGATIRILRGDLMSLLGVYEGTGIAAGYKNGDPNAASMLVYWLLTDALAKDWYEKSCVPESPDHPENPEEPTPLQPPKSYRLADEFRSLVLPLCQWPALGQDPAALAALWSRLLHVDAPTSERDEWVQWVLTTYKQTPAEVAVPGLLQSALTSPYLLLKR